MKAQEIEKRLEAMKGHTYYYGGSKHKVKNYLIDEDNMVFEIKTDTNTYRRKFESFLDFFKYWELVQENNQGNKKEVAKNEDAGGLSPVLFNQEKGIADEMVAILKDNINKVQANKDYIPQATAICANVDKILDVQKLKLEMMRQLRRLKQ